MTRPSPTVLAIAAACLVSGPNPARPADGPARAKRLDVIYKATPQEVVDRMLELAAPREGEVLYDLGSGDGRVVITAATRYGVDAVGVEIDPKWVRSSREAAREAGVGDRVTIREQDFFATDLRKADVVTMYLLPNLNARLLPRLAKMKPGSRVVCHSFDLRGIKPARVERVPLAKGGVRTLYLYNVPWDRTDDAAASPATTPASRERPR